MEKESLIKIGEQVMLARRREGITQAELALRAGVSQRVVSGLETASYRVSLESLIKTAKALEIKKLEL